MLIWWNWHVRVLCVLSDSCDWWIQLQVLVRLLLKTTCVISMLWFLVQHNLLMKVRKLLNCDSFIYYEVTLAYKILWYLFDYLGILFLIVGSVVSVEIFERCMSRLLKALVYKVLQSFLKISWREEFLAFVWSFTWELKIICTLLLMHFNLHLYQQMVHVQVTMCSSRGALLYLMLSTK